MSTFSDPDVFERMLLADPEEEFRQVCMCIRQGDVPKAREVYRGVNLNRPLSIWDRRPPLHLAISKSDAAMVRFLLQEASADPNMTDDKGRTSLHIAVLEGSDEIIQLLIDHNDTNFKAVDKWGQTALHLASLCANTSAAQLLLEHCRECLHYRQQDGITPLQIATMADNKQIAALFSAATEKDSEPSIKGCPDATDTKPTAGRHLSIPSTDSDTENLNDPTIQCSSFPQEISDLPTPPSVHTAIDYIIAPSILPPQKSIIENAEADEAPGLVQNRLEIQLTEIDLQSEASLGAYASVEASIRLSEAGDASELLRNQQDLQPIENDMQFQATAEIALEETDSPGPVQIEESFVSFSEVWKPGHAEDANSISYESGCGFEAVSRKPSLVFDFMSWRTLTECILHHSKHHVEVSELHSLMLTAYSSELKSKQEELSALKTLLIRFLQTHSQLAAHAPSVEELFAILISEKVAANHSQHLWKQLDAMALQLKCKDSELEELRSEISTLKSTIATLKSQQVESLQECSENLDRINDYKSKQPKLNSLNSNQMLNFYGLQQGSTSDDLISSLRNSGLKPTETAAAFETPSCLVFGSVNDANDTWILDWNLIGSVVSAAVDNSTRRIQVTFTNADSRPVSAITDSLGFNKASLGPFAVVFSSPRKNESRPATLYYKCFDSTSTKSDWSATLPEEDVLALCLIGRHTAFCSDRGILRIMSQSGIHLAILCLDFPAVSLAASSTDQFAVVMRDPSGCHHYMLFHLDLQAAVRKLSFGVCPVSINTSVSWCGFSEQGLFIVLDSTLVLRGLVSMHCSYQWIALLDASAFFPTQGIHILPLGASLSELLVATIKKGLVQFSPDSLPAPRKLPFKLPMMTVDGQDPIIEQRFFLNNVMINHYQSQEAIGKRRSEDEVTCTRLFGEQDASIIELFQAAVKDNNVNRALDLSIYLRNNLGSGRSNHLYPNPSS